MKMETESGVRQSPLMEEARNTVSFRASGGRATQLTPAF